MVNAQRTIGWAGLAVKNFGVPPFLCGADLTEASLVAERIRKRINTLDFMVNGECRELSVSIGGAALSPDA